MADDSDLRMPFGKYRGTYIVDLPDGYIDWILRTEDVGAEYIGLREAVRLERERRDKERAASWTREREQYQQRYTTTNHTSGYGNTHQSYHRPSDSPPPTTARAQGVTRRLAREAIKLGRVTAFRKYKSAADGGDAGATKSLANLNAAYDWLEKCAESLP